jgi:hypothetical protein
MNNQKILQTILKIKNNSDFEITEKTILHEFLAKIPLFENMSKFP